MCAGESQLKFLLIYILLFFSLLAKADCSMEQNITLSKLLKNNGVDVLSIGNIFAGSGECTFVISTKLGDGKLHTSYIYNGEDRYTKMLRHGLETYYSTYQVNNQIKSYERHYVYGKVEGLETNFYPNGKIASEIMYKNDLINGVKTTWNEEGIKISEKLYRNGVLVKANENLATNKASDENNQIEVAKNKCIKLGFKEKTEKFGICVLEIIK